MEGQDKTQHEEMMRLMREQLKVSHQILDTVEATHRTMQWNRIVNTIKLVLIIIPLLLAIIYLPPVFRRLADTYKGMFSAIDQAQQGKFQQIDPRVLENLLK